MKTKVVVAFALQQEFAPWRRRHRFLRLADSQRPVWMTSFSTTELYVTLVGAGARDAGHVNNLPPQVTPSFGIVTGVAAGLKPQWRPGDLLAAQAVCDSIGGHEIPSSQNLVELAIECGATQASRLVTVPQIARSVEEKKRLAVFADAADMESFPLMKQWSARGIPSLALRVILDPVEMPMSCDFESAMDMHGQMRIAALMAQLVRNPRLLPDFIHLALQSRRVLTILLRFLDRFFERLDRRLPTIDTQ